MKNSDFISTVSWNKINNCKKRNTLISRNWLISLTMITYFCLWNKFQLKWTICLKYCSNNFNGPENWLAGNSNCSSLPSLLQYLNKSRSIMPILKKNGRKISIWHAYTMVCILVYRKLSYFFKNRHWFAAPQAFIQIPHWNILRSPPLGPGYLKI